MQDCKITSDTGSGVGLEGGQLTVSRCSIHKCKQHGLALFNSLEGLQGTRHIPPVYSVILDACMRVGCP